MMPFNLTTERWLPLRHRSNKIEWGCPAHLTNSLDSDPVVAIAAPRPDLEGALYEFLIGLLTVALRPDDERAWRNWWISPPSPDLLRERFAALPASFDLDGEGVRFLQDPSSADLADADVVPIEQMLINAPGGQAVRLNKDLFVKRGRVGQLGRPAAAISLITLQTYSPAGGQGHRTSMRGGGPLTTLIEPRRVPLVNGDPEEALWYMLWANVLTSAQWETRPGAARNAPPDVFPWLAPTRASAKGNAPTTPADAHPLQAFFGMPRRIRLEFGDAGVCDLTGRPDERVVTGFRMRNYGVEYDGWEHPLSPYYSSKKDSEWLPVHGQPGGLAWKDWLGLTLQRPEGASQRPAHVVSHFLERRAGEIGRTEVRLRVFGYDMDNMKARGWTEAVRPAFAIDDPERRQVLIDLAERLTSGADHIAGLLQFYVKTALFERPKDAPGDFSPIKTELWSATEAWFFASVHRVVAGDGTAQGVLQECSAFRDRLESVATTIFDRWCPGAGLSPAALRRLVGARFTLVMTLRGKSKSGEELFRKLGLAVPESRKSQKATRSTTRKEAKS
ncbi:MAG TPA: type I-E CRISPR-associated protein Cse1/CasA [Candidatus Elarobacter sp.]|nr:type I-E CRISPR-associated protein Cse1/CasA [Candidatus Elarobacter sp.]